MRMERLAAGAPQVAAGHRGITGTGLKLIALVSMVLDHIYYFFGHTGCIPWWFGLIGRLAAPLFLFCLVEGFRHTRSRKKYFLKVLSVAVPMGLLLFFMRYGGVLVRPDGFYPQNAMLSSFVLLLICFQAFDWMASGKGTQRAAGCGLLLLLLVWPFLASMLSAWGPASATVVGLLGYTLLPMLNISGDVTLPVLLTGIVLYLTRNHRKLQVAAMVLVNFLWHFVLVYLQVRTWPDFALSQMFTMYYEWMGAIFAAPLLLWYNGRRGAGYGRFFYAFYPAHIYILYGVSWLLMAGLG